MSQRCCVARAHTHTHTHDLPERLFDEFQDEIIRESTDSLRVVASRDEQHVEDGLPPRLDVPRSGPHHLRAARGGGCECERMVW